MIQYFAFIITRTAKFIITKETEKNILKFLKFLIKNKN